MSTGGDDSLATMRRLLFGNRATHLIHVAAELGLADLLGDGPRPSAELARITGADSDALHRALRGLAELGPEPSREAIAAHADDPDFRVRLEAAAALRAAG